MTICIRLYGLYGSFPHLGELGAARRGRGAGSPRELDGANPLRKRGILAPLKELLVPYQPSDYRAIVAGDWEASEGRAAVVGGARQI